MTYPVIRPYWFWLNTETNYLWYPSGYVKGEEVIGRTRDKIMAVSYTSSNEKLIKAVLEGLPSLHMEWKP